VKPSQKQVFAFTNTPIELECQGLSNLNIEITNGSNFINFSISETDLYLFKGGPTKSKKVIVLNVTEKVSIKCSDYDQSHVWTIIPPVLKGKIPSFFIPVVVSTAISFWLNAQKSRSFYLFLD